MNNEKNKWVYTYEHQYSWSTQLLQAQINDRFFIGKGRYMSDEEARNYLYDHIEKGHNVLPMCVEHECPDFDYFGGGCPRHDVHYYDDDGNEITKEEYEKKGDIK